MIETTTEAGQAAEKALLMLSYDPGKGRGNPNESITLDSLADLRLLASQIELAQWHQAEVLRARGESMPSIGAAMGISKQAVHKRLTRT